MSGSGFADPRWGLSHRVSLEVSSGVCVGVRVRRSKTGLSQGVVWCVWGGQGSQIQDGAVTQGVVGGVVWCVCVGVRVRRSKTGLSQGVVGGVVWSQNKLCLFRTA